MKRVPQSRGVLLGLAAAVLLGACGGATTGDDPGSADGQPDTGAATEDQQDTESETEADPPPASVAEMTAEDGFTPLHDFELPEPGRATLMVDGESIDLRIRNCSYPFVSDNSHSHLFHFYIEAEGDTADGRRVQLAARWEIVTMEMRGSGFYDWFDHPGQSRASLEVFTSRIPGQDEGGLADLFVPSSEDPTAQRLPIIHVDPSGGFTADEDIPARDFSAEGTLEGRFQLAGRCQEG